MFADVHEFLLKQGGSGKKWIQEPGNSYELAYTSASGFPSLGLQFLPPGVMSGACLR